MAMCMWPLKNKKIERRFLMLVLECGRVTRAVAMAMCMWPLKKKKKTERRLLLLVLVCGI
jgi:hypothetical protein